MTELRHRRNSSMPKPEEEKEALLAESENEKATKESSDSNLDFADGYLIVPLAERWILSRLDVGPFLLCYIFLIILDYYGSSELGQPFVELVSQLSFPLILLAHIALFLLQQWDVFWRAAVGYRKLSLSSPRNQWTHCLVEAPHVDKHHSAHDAGIVSVNRLEDNVAVISFQDMIFRCSSGKNDIDAKLWSNANSVSHKTQQSFHRLRYPIHLPLPFYKGWNGHESLQNLVEAQRLYGSNTTPIRLPPFLEMLQEQLVAPFFLFQVLCVLLWSLDEYWYYAMFTFFALLMFESTVAYNRLKSLQRLRSHTLNSHQKIVWAYRPSFPMASKSWQQIYAHELVPGDIVSCKEATAIRGRRLRQKENHHLNRIPADILIISGDAVIDESLLTGESVPQLKTALDDGSDRCLDLQEHKQSICFGGTNLLVSHPGESTMHTNSQIPPAPDMGVIGMVLRSGFETAQGSLLRTMAHTQKSVDGIHTRDTYIFILLLLLCAVASASIVWQEGWADESRNKFRLVLHVIIIVTSVVPPELPMELSLAVTNSVADLMKRCQVYCTEIFRIPIAGQVDFCCFDKTGTLTSDEMQLKGVKLVTSDSTFGDLANPGSPMPVETSMVMAACHSLALGGSGPANIIGDPLEKAILEHTGYSLVNNHLLCKEEPTSGEPNSISILHRFGFTSRLKRMTVLAREDSSKSIWALTKGAPEILKKLLDPESCPTDYDEIAMHHMTQGQRVLAMAYRKLTKNETSSSLKDSKREMIESGLIFAGFLLLDCPVKGDSKSVIQELQRSDHRVVMITGDSVWTAAEVARQVSIIKKGALFHLQHYPKSARESPVDDPLQEFSFVPMVPVTSGDNDKMIKTIPIAGSALENLKKLVNDGSAILCISGDMLQKLVLSIVRKDESSAGHSSILKKEDKHALFHPAAQSVLKNLVPFVSIFARHAPRQKEAIVAALNLGGFKTLMCGDGTNDMASLRRAHVGISIISAPEVEAKQRDAKAKISAAKAQRKKGKKQRVNTGNDSRSSLEESLRQLQEAQEDLEQVELGDASIASPFTSRTVSIKCCKDVLQQGRCTLVTMLQIYKILGINCLVNAMVLSKLFLHGVKQGDRQLTVTGIAIAALFLFVTRGKPLNNISPLRPPQSVLCAEALLSIAIQFGIHFFCIRMASQVALSFVDPYDPSMIPDGPFNPNTLNTCTFLMNVLATVNTFAVNYRGEPFVEPLKQNKMLLRSLQICYVVLLFCALELFPPLSDLLQLSEFPATTKDAIEWSATKTTDLDINFLTSLAKELVISHGFPAFICGLMAFDTALTFASERLILRIFEPLPR